MANFSEIMYNAQQHGLPQAQPQPVPMPYVPGMPQGNQVTLPQVGPVEIQPQPMQQAQQPQPAQPTQDPAELEQRKAAWRPIIDNFMQQPNAREVMMMVGLKLLQGRQQGQSLGSQFGEAIGTGFAANQMYKQNAVEEERRMRQEGRVEQKHELDIRRGTAEADKAEAQNDFYKLTRAQALEEIQLGIDNLRRTGRVKDAELVEQEFNNGNLKAAWELKKRLAENEMWARGEQVKISRQNADKIPTAQQAKKDQEDLLRRAFRIEPGETPEDYDSRIAQMAVGLTTSGKTNRAADLIKLADSTEDDTKRQDLLDEAEQIIREGTTPRASVRAPATGRGGTQGSSAKKADWIKRAQAANPGMSLAEIQRRADEKFK